MPGQQRTSNQSGLGRKGRIWGRMESGTDHSRLPEIEGPFHTNSLHSPFVDLCCVSEAHWYRHCGFQHTCPPCVFTTHITEAICGRSRVLLFDITQLSPSWKYKHDHMRWMKATLWVILRATTVFNHKEKQAKTLVIFARGTLFTLLTWKKVAGDDKSNNYHCTHDCQQPQSWTRD